MSRAQRWTVWTLRNVAGKKKPDKVPAANPTVSTTWGYFHAARALLSDPRIAGLGFEMYGRPGVVGVDLDNCLSPTGERTPLAAEFLAILEAAGGKFHVEISPSGKGLRVFAGETPLPFHDFTNKETGVEVYTGEAGRFLAFTGHAVPGFGEGPFDALPESAVDFLGKHASKWKPGAARRGVGLDPAGNEQADGDRGGGLPLPELDRRDDWQKLHTKALKRLPRDHLKFITDGSVADRYASASEQLFAVEQALSKHLKLPQAYQILISAEGSWSVALEHRGDNDQKAREFIWIDLQRAAAGRERREQEKALTTSDWKACDIRVEIVDDVARAKLLQINIINSLQKHSEWLNRLAYNEFDGRVTIDRREAAVRDLAEMAAWVCEFLKWQYEPQRAVFEEAVIEAAKTRPWNPVAEELRGLVWDGKPRFKKLAEAMVEEPTALDVEILRKFLIGYVARGMTPGCDMHTVLCLREREGGGFKTKFCRVLARSADRYSDSPGFGSDKDSSMLRAGMRVIELGEAVAVKRGDRFDLKRDITKIDDHFRPPWGRTTERRKRGFVYVLTTQDVEFLRSDQDGLRRIWPLDVKSIIDIEWIEENLDQLLAQAVKLFDEGKPWWWDKGEEPEELKERQGTAVQEDPLDEAVSALVRDKESAEKGYIMLSEVKRFVEASAGTIITINLTNHLIDILRKHGFQSGQNRIDGFKIRLWRHPSWKPIGEAKIIELREKDQSAL